jgi:hypothetical protein
LRFLPSWSLSLDGRLSQRALENCCRPLENRREATAASGLFSFDQQWLTGVWLRSHQEVQVEFRLLGPFEVVVGGQSADLGGAKQRALLAMLAIMRMT